MARQLNARIITKHDTEESWSKVEGFTPKLGEIIVYDADNLAINGKASIPRIKIGDGERKINDLPFITEPYVLKEDNKGLSEHNYTTEDWTKVKNIPDNPVYTDTKYEAGLNLGLFNNKFYNKGVVDILKGEENGTIKVGIRKGPEEENIEYLPVEIGGIKTAAFYDAEDFASSEQGARADKAILSVTTGIRRGCVRVEKYIKGEDRMDLEDIDVSGLGELAFLDSLTEVENLDNKVKALENSLRAHMEDYENPHQITEEQIIKTENTPTPNDYAEYRESSCDQYGYVLVENGDDTLSIATERLQPFAGVVSDTWGFCIGKTEKAKTPIAVAGRVLAHTYRNRNEYKPGDCVCTAPNGTIDIMTREEITKYPDRIVGTVSCVPEYLEWSADGRPSIKIDNRIWIKI